MTEGFEDLLDEIKRNEEIEKESDELNKEINKVFENNNCFDINNEHCDDVSCEECENYMSRNCVLVNVDSHGDDWADENVEGHVNNIDDILEEKFRHR